MWKLKHTHTHTKGKIFSAAWLYVRWPSRGDESSWTSKIAGSQSWKGIFSRVDPSSQMATACVNLTQTNQHWVGTGIVVGAGISICPQLAKLCSEDSTSLAENLTAWYKFKIKSRCNEPECKGLRFTRRSVIRAWKHLQEAQADSSEKIILTRLWLLCGCYVLGPVQVRKRPVLGHRN